MPTTAPLYTRTFWIACALHFTGGMSHAMLLLLPLFVRTLGGDELTIGLVLGAGAAASVGFRPVVGLLLDRVGRRRVLLGAGAINTLSLPLFILLDRTGGGLYLLVAVHMVVGGALFAAYFTYAADLVPPGRRVEGIAIFGVAGMAPNGLGPALGEVLIAHAGYASLFLAAAGFALISLALTTLVPEMHHASAAPSGDRARARDVARLARDGRLLPVLLATVIFGAGINAAFYFVAPFTRDLGLARAAPFFAAYATTTIVLRIFGRRLPDRLGPHPVALPSFAVFSLGLGLLCLLPGAGMLVLAGIACGAGHGSIFPVLSGLVVARTPRRFHGIVMSLYTAALDAGGVVGVPLCGAIAKTAGYRVMFAVMALASLGGLVLLLVDRRRSGRRRAAPLAAALLLLLGPGTACAAEWPRLASGPLEDNSFLVEEAYNQEPGVVQHVGTALHDTGSGDWQLGFTQEWPVPDQRNQLSFTVPYTFAGAGAASGVGDVLLNYRRQVLAESERRPAFAPRLSLLLPTGSVREGLGTGSAGVQVNLPLSKRLGRALGNLNLGATLVPHALAPRGRSELLASWNAGGSLIWLLADAINPLVELVASRDQEMAARGVATRTHVTLDPGLRVGWNGPGSIQWVGGIGLPIGLTRDTDDFGVFLYLSIEHAFTPAAYAERQW